jgi:hypothetical protein
VLFIGNDNPEIAVLHSGKCNFLILAISGVFRSGDHAVSPLRSPLTRREAASAQLRDITSLPQFSGKMPSIRYVFAGPSEIGKALERPEPRRCHIVREFRPDGNNPALV